MNKLIARFDTPVHHEQIRALYRQSPFLFLGILAAMAVVTVFFWDVAEPSILFGWLTINILLTLARVILVKSFHHINPEGTALVKWGLVFVLSATLSGIIWGSISLLFMTLDNIESVLLVCLILTGMSSGSQVALSTFLPAFFGFGLPTLLPLAVIMIAQSEVVYVLIGYLVVAFIVVNMGFSFVINRNVSESIKLRFENLDLLENFRQQKNIAEKANTDKSRFLAATSHDLRQPLHAMDLYLGALKNLLTEEEQIQLLKKGQQSSAALSELLASLMDVSRLDAGEVVVDRTAVDIRTLLQTIADECREQTEQPGISLDVQAENLLVDSDALMLGRMLRNLVNNACIHSGGSKVLLTAERLGEQVVVSVRDDGVGIPNQEQQQIFSEFYQLNNSERDRSKGLGLGLAIVKRLASLLHHEIQLESTAGNGCCFKLYLPFVDVAENSVAETATAADFDVSGLFVILVDDETDIRIAMRTLLLQWGCELLVADSLQSLQQELDKLQYPVPDVLLCDYRLRENQTGLEVVVAMRQFFKTQLPALIISGDTDKIIEEKAKQLDCDVLHKPVRPDVLRAAIFQCASAGLSGLKK